MRWKRSYTPLALIVAALACEMAAIVVLAPSSRRAVVYVDDQRFALDYRVFYDASVALRKGDDPYLSVRYVTPPTAALLNRPLTLLPFEQAAWVAAAGTVVCLLLAQVASTAAFFSLRTREGWTVLALGVAVMALSYPAYFLVYRGNIDAFVLAPMCLALLLSRRRGVVAGACVGLAAALKVYPALLAVPLAIQRRWRVLASAGVVLALFVALTPGLWAEAVRRMLWRSSCFEMTENGSLACTFAFFGKAMGLPVGIGTWRVLGLAAFGVLLALTVWADVRRRARRDEAAQRVAAFMYLPFMAAVPALSFHYGLVVVLPLLPVVAHLWKPRASKGLRLIVVGLVLAQVQAVALACLAGSVVPHAIPGVGLFLVLLGCLRWKLSGDSA